MRNYWALLPAIAVCVCVALLYAVPTLVRPQFTANLMAAFRRDTAEPPALGPRELRNRRLGAVAVLVGALVLVGFNVSLNREQNGCYSAAQAWGADDVDERPDACLDKLWADSVVTRPQEPGDKLENTPPQPLPRYQVVDPDDPSYLKWVGNRPDLEGTAFIVGKPGFCGEVTVIEEPDTVTVVDDVRVACPPASGVVLHKVTLERPLGDRKVVTVDDKPMERIDPRLPSWGSVLGKLVTGG
jgi:hypothetical protein